MQMVDMFYDELEDAKKRQVPFIIPIGTMEYHAMHLSNGTDTMVINGVMRELEKKKEIVVCPPIWYGVSSYAVAGPEKGTIHVDVDAYEDYIACILKSMIYGGVRNIYCVVFHQSGEEQPMPMMAACHKASKKVIMEYLEKTKGLGWWGSNEYATYYENMGSEDDPFSYIKVIPLANRACAEGYGDDGGHADKFETSLMYALYPENVDMERTKYNTEWFAEDAIAANKELGKMMVGDILRSLDRIIV